jgi:uncharacterized coiled-coil DUF342 family protein
MKRRAQDFMKQDIELEELDAESERPFEESGEQSGDIQGLSTEREAAHESVAELAEEGQAFEAGVLEGVQEAEENPERPTVSHEDRRPFHESELPPEKD